MPRPDGYLRTADGDLVPDPEISLGRQAQMQTPPVGPSDPSYRPADEAGRRRGIEECRRALAAASARAAARGTSTYRRQ